MDLTDSGIYYYTDFLFFILPPPPFSCTLYKSPHSGLARSSDWIIFRSTKSNFNQRMTREKLSIPLESSRCNEKIRSSSSTALTLLLTRAMGSRSRTIVIERATVQKVRADSSGRPCGTASTTFLFSVQWSLYRRLVTTYPPS